MPRRRAAIWRSSSLISPGSAAASRAASRARRWRGAQIGPLVGGAPGVVGSAPLLITDARLAVQAEPGSPPPHPQAEAQGHELAGLRGRVASARQPDRLVHGGGGRSVGGGTTHDPRRPALVLAPGDPDRVDLAGGVPPGVPAGRGADRLRRRPARAGAARAGPYPPQSPGRDAGSAAAAASSSWRTKRRTSASSPLARAAASSARR